MSVGAPQPDDEFLRIMAQFHANEQARIESATSQLRDVLVPQLRQYGVANVEAAYSGYGDSGTIDGVQYRDSAGQRVARETIPAAIHESLDNCLYEFLPAGFEINDGGQGTLTVDVQTSRVTIKHQENYTESRDSTREFTL